MPVLEKMTVKLSLDAEEFERDIDRLIEKLERLKKLQEDIDARNA
jgi:ACT domain-containing protein